MTAGGERVFGEDDSGNITNTSENTPITQEQQEYVWVLEDSEGRPIGRKYSRMLLMYNSMAAISVEIFYSWASTCVLYALLPDLYLSVGRDSGELLVEPKATVDISEMNLGFRLYGETLGEKECIHKANCGTHDYFPFGPTRREFEVVILRTQGVPGDPDTVTEFDNGGKAFYPNAGQALPNFPEGALISFLPGTQWLLKHGPMWYPYIECERPRYNEITLGPFNTDSTELINLELSSPGLSSAGAANSAGQSNAGTGASVGSPVILTDEQANAAAGGEYGSLPPQSDEAYRGPDRMVAKILDVHPSIRICTSAFTYGNRVLKESSALDFKGYGRKRGEVDLFWSQGLGWEEPPFGNFGRAKLTFEVTSKRGDYLGGFNGRSPGFRWMPMFPEREDIGGTVELWSEDLEPQQYRLINSSTPLGSISETVDSSATIRHRHKELIINIAAAAIEYPFAPYFPSFIPDSLLGIPQAGRASLSSNHGQPISTMWAWREQEPTVLRGQAGSSPIPGLQFTSPDYFLDNRRLEVQLRPDEGNYIVTFIPPVYDEDGNQTSFGTLQLGSGPPREVSIDYSEKEFSILENGIYDTSRQINEGDDDEAIPCANGTLPDNGGLGSECECVLNIDDESLKGSPPKLPSRFLHLDEFATTPNQFALYASDTIQTPVTVDIARDNIEDPCCQCLYYIKGVLAEISLEDLPITTDLDPIFDSRVNVKYTWSRVPHGLPRSEFFPSSDGVDGAFNSREHLADSYIEAKDGEIFLKRFGTGVQSTAVEDGDIGAFFPSSRLAQDLRTEESTLRITPTTALPPGDPSLKGGIAATPIPTSSPDNLFSNGQTELINIDMVFDTPVKILSVNIIFMAGEDENAFSGRARIKWQTPIVTLGVIDSENRVGPPPFITRRTPRVLGTSILRAFGKDVPGDFTTNQRTIINNGGFLFNVPITPSYTGVPYWNQFGQEFHLIFDARDNDGSLGIASIEIEVRAMVPSSTQLVETIGLRERKYYISPGVPAEGNNPESFLAALDSATAYWRTANENPIKGANKFRSYAWNSKLEDNQLPEESDIKTLEKLQENEYNLARNLQAGSPYEFSYDSFFPLDERKFLEFVDGGTVPSWVTTLSQEISAINEVKASSGNLHFGEVPVRANWTAPGHAWTHNFVTAFGFCCSPPSRCPAEMTMDYNFSHLHDGLTVVQTARFWDELPSGFSRLIRSTELAPDAGFLSGDLGERLSGENILLINEKLLLDVNGQQIDPRILDQAGYRQGDDDENIIIEKGS